MSPAGNIILATDNARFAEWVRRHALVTSLLVLFCSLSVRLFITLREDPNHLLNGYSDARSYLGPATSLLGRGALLNTQGTPEIHRTPGYPVFIAGIMAVNGVELRRTLLTQAIILSFGPLLLYLLARRILPPAPALIAGVIAAVSPWGAVLATVPLSDGLFLALLTSVFLLMKIAADSAGPRAFVAASTLGVVAGLAVLVRPIWPLAVVVPAAFLVYLPERKGARLLCVVILICALAPVGLWRERNKREAQFASISDITSETAWQYLAARVRGEVTGQDRFALVATAAEEEQAWGLPQWSQQIHDERWRQAGAVFKAHPFLTLYAFTRSALEHMVHPSPDVLAPAGLSFRGDYVVLATTWGTLLLIAGYGLACLRSASLRFGTPVDGRLIVIVLTICLLITFSSGISFGAGSRLRAPMEAIVPLLAALGISGLHHSLRRPSVAERRP